MTPFHSTDIEEKFQSYPIVQRQKLLEIREMIFDIAQADERIGPLSEVLRWGEPSYITKESGAGSTVRIGLFEKQKVAIFFNCRTVLIETFKNIYGDALEYSKNRAIIINLESSINKDILSSCILMALVYKLRK